jgi:hypothetical protein
MSEKNFDYHEAIFTVTLNVQNPTLEGDWTLH